MNLKKINDLYRGFIVFEAYLYKRLMAYSTNPKIEIRRQILQKIEIMKKFTIREMDAIVKYGYNQGESRAERQAKKIAERIRSGKPKIEKLQDSAAAITLKAFRIMKREIILALDAMDNYGTRRLIKIQNFTKSEEYLKGIDNIIEESQIQKVRTTRTGFDYVAVATRHEVKKDIASLAYNIYGKMDFVAITMKNGKVRRYRPKYYFNMVARTEMINASTAAIKTVTKEYGLELVQVSEHFNSCPVCAPFQGQIYAISGRHPMYEEAGELPPFHPYCRHFIRPISLTVIAAMRRLDPTSVPPIRRGLSVRGIQEGLKKKAA